MVLIDAVVIERMEINDKLDTIYALHTELNINDLKKLYSLFNCNTIHEIPFNQKTLTDTEVQILNSIFFHLITHIYNTYEEQINNNISFYNWGINGD